MIGQTIDDRYHIEALIGRGGMGAVYRATDLIENRPVALKVLHFYLDPETGAALTRFRREFRVLARLNHPHIVQAYGYGSYNDSPYLVLEFLAGRTLSEDLAAGPLSRPRLLLIARQICEALIHLHAQSIIHRDLKPGNLMLVFPDDAALVEANGQVETNMQVKLMDFGLIRQTNLSMQLTQEGVALGTVAYMAPEQAQGLPVDFRADLYALGIILYEMATGRPPFVHENPAMVLMQQLTTAPPSPRRLNPALDEPLEQLILDLLAKEPARRPAGTEAVAARLAQLADETAPVPAPPQKRADLIPRIPLVGRESALNELSQRWAKLHTGEYGQVILLAGTAGAGKTRLLTETSLQVQLGEDRFLRGQCREQASLPYQPLDEVLDALLPDLPAAVRDTLPVELAQLLPGASAGASDDIQATHAGTDQAEARLRLFAACWEVLRQAAQTRTLVIAIEDVQWANPTTLELLGYLAHRLNQAHILLILTYRPEEVESGGPLATLQRDLRHDQLSHKITLSPLSHDQVGDFLRSALGRERVPPWLVDSFHQATGGNPLFIEETLKTLAAEGQVAEWAREESSQWKHLPSMTLQLPQNVLALAERRLQALAADDRAILTSAAVLGAEFPFALLQGVTKLDEDTLLDAIDRLLAAHLIEELPLQDGEDRYRFSQEALRQALLNTISQRRQRRLHKRTGEMIRELYDTGQAQYWPVLAYHFAEAGNEDDALKYYILAGDAAARVYAHAETVSHYSRALEFAGRGIASNEQLAALYARRGRALELSGLYDDALANYRELETLAHEHNSQALELAALIPQATLCSTYTAKFDPAQGRNLSERALVLAQELKDYQAETRVLWTLMLLKYYGEQNPEQARIYGEQALNIAREYNLREEMAYILSDFVGVYAALAQREQAGAALAEAGELWREMNNLPMLAANLLSGAEGCYIDARTDEALELAQEALRLSRSTGSIWGQARGMSLIGPIYMQRGQLGAAVNIMEEALPLAEQANLAIPLSVHLVLAWAYSFLGDFERGFELAHFALAQAEKFGRVRSYALAMLTLLHIYNGDPAKAKTLFQEALVEMDADQSASKLFYNWFLYMVGSEVALASQAYDDAFTLIERTIESTRTVGIRPFLTYLLFLKSQTLLGLDRIDEAREVLIEARAESDAQADTNLQRFEVLYGLSKVEAQLGNIVAAQTLLAEAGEVVNIIAGHIDDAKLRASFLAISNVRAALENR